MKSASLAVIFVLGCTVLQAQTATWQSERVQLDARGDLVYSADSSGNRIPDFSFAGYLNSNAAIPDIPAIENLSPIAGDNTRHIQDAIDRVAELQPDVNGFRGAVELSAGIYTIRTSLNIRTSGIVLRGAGDEADSTQNTIFRCPAILFPAQRTIIRAGGGDDSKWRHELPDSRVDIVSDFVPVGANQFRVADVSGLAAGQNIIIVHPCTEEWLEAIDYGGTWSTRAGAVPGVDVPWDEDSQPIVYNRFITAISQDTVTIDVPVYNHLDRSLAQSYFYQYDRSRLVTNIGIEGIRIDIETEGGTDERHAWNGIDLYEVEDAWVRDCTVLHFGESAIRTNTATRITIENCKALDPVAEITGGRMYNFNAYTASQQILFKNCHARNGRHHYMSNGMSWTSGIVFLDCTSEGAYAASEGHRRWSTGLLYDNHREIDTPRDGYTKRRIGLYNRGYFGTSHGWSAAHSVAWNSDVNGGELHVQKPPTAQNYAIGCSGIVTGASPPNSFPDPAGYIEGANRPGLEPRSLFEAQLQARLSQTVAVRSPEQVSIERDVDLLPAFPNPFREYTTLQFSLRQQGQVSIRVFTASGQEIYRRGPVNMIAGSHRVRIELAGKDKPAAAAGVYFYQISAGDELLNGKLLHLP